MADLNENKLITLGNLKKYTEKIKELISNNSYQEITYSNLKNLRDNSLLTPGTWYRITDYETTVFNNDNARAAEHPFDVVVLAIDVNQLSEDAKAVRSARDTEGYFAHANLAAWKLKYSLDNDSAKFAWASDGGEKWTVTLPELGAMDLTPVSTDDSTYEGFPYKFTSNVQGMAVEVYFAHLELQEGEEFIPNIIYIAAMGQAMTNQFPVMEIVHEEQTPGKGVIWEMEDEYNNLCCYDFKNVQFKRSLIIATKENPSDEECAFYGKYVGQALEELPALPEGYAIDPNNSKFLYTFSVIAADGTVEDNSMGVDLTSAGMGIYHLCALNRMRENINASSFALDLNNNVFVATCASPDEMMNLIQMGNTFGTLCMGNTFVNAAMENTFGNDCYSNSFGNYCYNNSFGNECYRNSFGNDCDYNSFGNSCDGNSFGNYCTYNSFGNDCNGNSFGNNCYNNSFGNECYYNSFGNGCQYNDILSNVQYITLFEGVEYVSIGSDNGTVQYAQVLNGTKGSSAENLHIDFTTDVEYTQVARLGQDGKPYITPMLDCTQTDIESIF